MVERTEETNNSPDEEIQEFRTWDIQLRSNYTGPCLLRNIDPTRGCNGKSWNHIVARGFLSLITTNRKVLYWDILSGRTLALQSMVGGRTGRKLVEEIDDFKPDCIGIVNDPRCRIKGACNYHDDKAFELIETPSDFDAGNRQHQVTIGMRAAFAETASLSNWAGWLAGHTRGKPKAFFIEIQKINAALDRSNARLQEWISTVNRNALSEVQTTYWNEKLPIPIAVCGTSNTEDSSSAPAVNLMPRDDGQTDILISVRPDGTKEQEDKDKDTAEIERLTNVIESLKNDPAKGIEMLIRTTDQVFLSPADFNDDAIMSDSERRSLREGIARYRAESFQRFNQKAKVPFRRRR